MVRKVDLSTELQILAFHQQRKAFHSERHSDRHSERHGPADGRHVPLAEAL